STERPEKTRRPSGACVTPMRTISAVLRPTIDLPCRMISPAVGWMRPEIVLISVVLPAPLEPTMAIRAPLPIENEMSRSAGLIHWRHSLQNLARNRPGGRAARRCGPAPKRCCRDRHAGPPYPPARPPALLLPASDHGPVRRSGG